MTYRHGNKAFKGTEYKKNNISFSMKRLYLIWQKQLKQVAINIIIIITFDTVNALQPKFLLLFSLIKHI